MDASQELTSQTPPPEDHEASDFSYGEWLSEQLGVHDVAPITLAEMADLSVQTVNLILSGATQNPQNGTRQRIEAALTQLSDDSPISGETPVPSADDLHVGIPFTRDEIDQAPASIGVYVVHDRRGHPTYIGSGAIRTRLKKHWDSRGFVDERVAHRFSYYVVQKESTGQGKDDAVKMARTWERVIIKFAGNTLLLNTQHRESLDSPEDE